jgi:hypothetical protein
MAKLFISVLVSEGIKSSVLQVDSQWIRQQNQTRGPWEKKEQTEDELKAATLLVEIKFVEENHREDMPMPAKKQSIPLYTLLVPVEWHARMDHFHGLEKMW